MYSFLKNNKTILVYVPLTLYWILLLILTSIPASAMINVNVSDKIEHFAAYMVLSVLVCFTYNFQQKFHVVSKHPFLFTVFTVALYGLMDELHQMLIPGRYCDIKDWTADFLGAILGVLVVFIIKSFDSNRELENLI